ncbi:IS630 transposase-related protein, partial [Streptococcus danieliae]
MFSETSIARFLLYRKIPCYWALTKQQREQGHLERKKRVAKSRKIPLDQLKNFVKENPDAFLREIAEHFSCSIPSVWAA